MRRNSNILAKLLSKLYICYLELVARTSRIEIDYQMPKGLLANSMIGFWHENSFVMNILVREIKDRNLDLSVIVTRDARGDLIESMLSHYGGKSIRLPDGLEMKKHFRDLQERCKEENHTVCIALDGPLGPYHKPKRLAFGLAEVADKPVIFTRVSCSNKIRLKKRWDQYVIPLPFGHIQFTLGETNYKDMKEYFD